ncbi:hypothetical protein WA026_013239 [Henosepilachna vigintioctopunctata]|uniref:Uncharacterized protein n=1 Tax=Henosepilachna vigintioctopunctata TaxID=420089 RepID=A0AAW1ULJ6_9CUCU
MTLLYIKICEDIASKGGNTPLRHTPNRPPWRIVCECVKAAKGGQPARTSIVYIRKERKSYRGVKCPPSRLPCASFTYPFQNCISFLANFAEGAKNSAFYWKRKICIPFQQYVSPVSYLWRGWQIKLDRSEEFEFSERYVIEVNKIRG